MSVSDPHSDQPIIEYGAPLNDAAAAVILIHGRGDSAAGILGLAREINDSRTTFVAPQAASGPYGPTWYPNSFLAPLPLNQPWLDSALARIAHVHEDLLEKGFTNDRIILAGFSQGACLASEYAARNPARYGALIGLSGGLIGTADIPGVDPPVNKELEYPGDLDGTPVFLGCSDVDPHIPLQRVEDTADVFRRIGGSVDLRIYENMPHTINDDELKAFTALINQVAS